MFIRPNRALKTFYPTDKSPIDSYQLGHDGRIEFLSAEIRMANIDQGKDTTKEWEKWAKERGIKTDTAGMIISSRLGGDGTDPVNLFPKSPNLDSTLWKSDEEKMYSEAQGMPKWKKIKFIIKFEYPEEKSLRPSTINYQINMPSGNQITRKIFNDPSPTTDTGNEDEADEEEEPPEDEQNVESEDHLEHHTPVQQDIIVQGSEEESEESDLASEPEAIENEPDIQKIHKADQEVEETEEISKSEHDPTVIEAKQGMDDSQTLESIGTEDDYEILNGGLVEESSPEPTPSSYTVKKDEQNEGIILEKDDNKSTEETPEVVASFSVKIDPNKDKKAEENTPELSISIKQETDNNPAPEVEGPGAPATIPGPPLSGEAPVGPVSKDRASLPSSRNESWTVEIIVESVPILGSIKLGMEAANAIFNLDMNKSVTKSLQCGISLAADFYIGRALARHGHVLTRDISSTDSIVEFANRAENQVIIATTFKFLNQLLSLIQRYMNANEK